MLLPHFTENLISPSKIVSLLESGRSEFVYSAYQLYFERRGVAQEYCGGKTSYWPDSNPVHAGTYFDIGSISKVVVTASQFALALQTKKLNLEDRLGNLVPEFSESRFAAIPIGDLLHHCSGLKAWAPLYETLRQRTLIEWFLEEQASLFDYEVGRKNVYSDLGFLLLGIVLDKTAGGIENGFLKSVVEPLGLTEVAFGPRVSKPADFAATEFCLWRKRLLQGEVFDENCWALGGVSSHAGLFATARGMAPWCREWLSAVRGNSRWLSRETATRMTQPVNRIAGSTWGYGWDTKSSSVGGGYSGAGTLFSRQSFGHYGYPGCSVWLDPQQEGFAIFFTNRVHPSRVDERIRSLRPLVHDRIAEVWQALSLE